MRAIVQRVKHASVTVDGEVKSKIDKGLLVLLGVEDSDSDEDLNWLVAKIARSRIFNNENGQMNLSLEDVSGDVIVVSQFTLYASTKKGNRPSYLRSAKPDFAEPMYEKFVQSLEKEIGKPVGTGVFGAHMDVDLLNDGPVTIMYDTKVKE